MPFTIPLRSDLPHFDISVELEGVNYTLEFYWNTREACFYMDIFDNNQEPVLLSVKAVIDQPLGFRYVSMPFKRAVVLLFVQNKTTRRVVASFNAL